MASTVRIIFFGTGGSWPSPDRNVISIGLQVDSEVLLFDCGEGTQRQMMHTNMSFMKIKRIFITHYHGDHFLGLAGLIQTMTLNDRKEPLEIYGPTRTVDILTNYLSSGYYSLTFPIKLYELEGGETLDFGDYTISTLKVAHPVPTLAYAFKEKDIPRIDKKKADKYRLDSKILEKLRKEGEIIHNGKRISIEDVRGGIRIGRKIVYSGDTAPIKEMEDFARDTDILIHEATVESSLEEKANQYGHSSARQAALIAKNARVGELLLVHISPRYKNTSSIEKEAKAIFPRSRVVRDLEEVVVKVRKNQGSL
ncbi:MAG TPA: ribonuclease Z [candidate division WOR-3 bacterium]|uniref:Ribonuclease Z n=1 Tax=candidate division WOR-3 bacterium TaxID=2052148 RepID=A0A7C5HFZ9_UNCW3|nr:ribonuclease Z [candidate division WOR-3 bacterium]